MVSGGGTGHGSLCQIRAIRAGLRGAASRMEQNLDVFGLHPWPTTDAGVDPEQDRSTPHVALRVGRARRSRNVVSTHAAR